jgi:acyl carrier protein
MVSMDNLRQQLQDLFRDVFDDDSIVVTDEMTGGDIDGWDSLMHINVIVAAEKVFGVDFSVEEITALKQQGQTVGTFLQLVSEKIAAGS